MLPTDEKESPSNSNSDAIAKLVAYNGSLQMAHWCADTVTNEHKTLGNLYEKMVELVDDFAEVYMGKNGLISASEQTMSILDDPCEEGLELVQELSSSFTAGKDDDLINILADMQAALNKAKYLLKSAPANNGNKTATFSTEAMPK